MKLDRVEFPKLAQCKTCGYSSNSARHPELLEYPHAILKEKKFNSTMSNFVKILIRGVPKVLKKYGMWVLKQLKMMSTL